MWYLLYIKKKNMMILGWVAVILYEEIDFNRSIRSLPSLHLSYSFEVLLDLLKISLDLARCLLDQVTSLSIWWDLYWIYTWSMNISRCLPYITIDKDIKFNQTKMSQIKWLVDQHLVLHSLLADMGVGF